jgi:hypothetical protein
LVESVIFTQYGINLKSYETTKEALYKKWSVAEVPLTVFCMTISTNVSAKYEADWPWHNPV